MASLRYFRDLDAWQSAMELAVAADSLADSLPATHRFELASQIRRSTVSVPSNIAEGYAQRRDRVLLQHVRIALGSLAELDTQIEIAVRRHLVTDAAVKTLEPMIARTGQLRHGLRRTLSLTTLISTTSIILALAATGGVLWLGLRA